MLTCVNACGAQLKDNGAQLKDNGAQLKDIDTFEDRLIELKRKVIENFSQLLPIPESPVEAPRGRK